MVADALLSPEFLNTYINTWATQSIIRHILNTAEVITKARGAAMKMSPEVTMTLHNIAWAHLRMQLGQRPSLSMYLLNQYGLRSTCSSLCSILFPRLRREPYPHRLAPSNSRLITAGNTLLVRGIALPGALQRVGALTATHIAPRGLQVALLPALIVCIGCGSQPAASRIDASI